MKNIYTLIAFIYSGIVIGQVTSTTDYNAGLGTSVCSSIDNNALRFNPSNLGWQHHYYDHQFSLKVFSLNAALYSPVNIAFVKSHLFPFDDKINQLNSPLTEITESFEDNGRFDTTFSIADRNSWSNALQNKTSIHYNRVLFGASYVSPKLGTFAVQVSNEFFFQFQFSKDLADLFTLGKANPYFDTLQLTNGTLITNDYPNLSNDTLYDVVHAWSAHPKTIGQMMNGSNIRLLSTRYYSLGWGKSTNTFIPGWETYIGATFNFIQGRKIHDVRVLDNEYYYKNSSAISLSQSDFKQSPGAGASINLGLSFIREGKWFLGASLNNLGFIRWKDNQFNEVSSYNSTTDFEVFDQTFGKSPTTSFFYQWSFMKLGIKDSKDFNDSARFTTATAANFSFGTKRIITDYFNVSSDLVLPLNPNAIGNAQQPYISLGAELVAKKIGLTVGVNNYFSQLNVPMGITFGSRKSTCQFSITTLDMVNYFEKEKMQNLSLGASFSIRLK